MLSLLIDSIFRRRNQPSSLLSSPHAFHTKRLLEGRKLHLLELCSDLRTDCAVLRSVARPLEKQKQTNEDCMAELAVSDLGVTLDFLFFMSAWHS